MNFCSLDKFLRYSENTLGLCAFATISWKIASGLPKILKLTSPVIRITLNIIKKYTNSEIAIGIMFLPISSKNVANGFSQI